VFVYPGTYYESVDLKGKAITIKGIAGPLGLPMLVATGQSAVQMLSGEDTSTVLQNLIIIDSLVGISLVDSNPTLQNMTVVKCGIGVLGLGRSHPMINSCILWGNALEDLAGVTAVYSCVEKLHEVSRLYNMSVDPFFVDSKNNDYRLKTSHGRYESSLDLWIYDEITSPCISTGDPAMEFGLEPQANGDRINMGAFGNTVYASTGPDPSRPIQIVGLGRGSGTGGYRLHAMAAVESPLEEIARVEFYMNGILVTQDDNSQEWTDTKWGWYWHAEWSIEFNPWDTEFEIVAAAEDIYGIRSFSPVITKSDMSGRPGGSR